MINVVSGLGLQNQMDFMTELAVRVIDFNIFLQNYYFDSRSVQTF